jgi:hypothetical protein
MLTDDHLTRELGAAFREATRDLEYAGPVPTPRRTPLLLVPAAALSAATVVLVAGSLGDGPNGAQPAPPGRSAATSQPRLVTDTVTFAGYTFSYQRRAGAPDPLRVQLAPHGLPEGMRKVAVEPPAKAWVGADPASGDAALYVEAPTRNEGRLFVLSSSTWTQAELVRLLHSGRPNG